MNGVKYGFDPVIFDDSKLLILGSFPSVKSRQVEFYSFPNNSICELVLSCAKIEDETSCSLPLINSSCEAGRLNFITATRVTASGKSFAVFSARKSLKQLI